jgi:lysophospholipase L1-like esterase
MNSYSDESPYYSPYYFHRKNQLDLLPIQASDIVFLGDSLTNEGEWADWFPGVTIKNRGISGDTTYGVLTRLEPILAGKPRKIFLMIGVNDITKDVPVQRILYNYTEIINQVRTRTPDTEMFVISVLPVDTQFHGDRAQRDVMRLNDHLQRLAQRFSCQYIDLCSEFLNDRGELDAQYSLDGLHLNGHAYRLWQQMIQEYVQ